jgi:hypothetical protein
MWEDHNTMHLNKRFLMLALAAVAAAAFMVPASASAAGSGHCSFTGLAGNIDPGVMLTGGQGEYEFATQDPNTTKCSLGTGAPVNSAIVSKGNFVNTVCGTGLAYSGHGNQMATPDVTTIDSPVGGTVEITGASYSIDFRAAQGALNILTVRESNGHVGTDSLPANGHVTIVPSEGGCSEPGGVTAFTVAGHFQANWN